MRLSWQTLLSRIDNPKSGDVFARVRTFIHTNGLESVKKAPSISNALETRSIWQVRLENATLTNVPIPGAPALVENLLELSPETKVEQYSFSGETLAGSIFFNRETGKFLGDTIVQRRHKSDQILNQEAELFRSTRKSA